MPFNIQCKTFITIRNDKKIVLCFSQDFLAFGPFLGFFWPSEGLRPPSGQKNPKNGPQAKKPGCSTKVFFVLPHVDIVLHFNIEIYHLGATLQLCQVGACFQALDELFSWSPQKSSPFFCNSNDAI